MSRIMIVGEFYDESAEDAGQPFVGASGWTLDRVLSQAGIKRSECFCTVVIHARPPRNDVDGFCGRRADGVPDYNFIRSSKYLRAEFQPDLERLGREIEREQPNLILALGNFAMWALCKKTGLKKYRGTQLPTYDGKWKVLATYSPNTVMRQWALRPIMVSDCIKAERFSAIKELSRPSRKIWIEPTLSDIEEFYHEHIAPMERVSCDIETAAGQITEISFAPNPNLALVIPFYDRERVNYWKTVSEELEAWAWVRRICEEKKTCGQNFIYDMSYLWRTVGIPCPRMSDDTMLLHHALQPELVKDLGFLGSIYTDEPSWKFMRHINETLKKED